MCADCDWAQMSKKMVNMVEKSNRYAWAAPTIAGIYRNVTEHGHITPNQERAVKNIEASVRFRR